MTMTILPNAICRFNIISIKIPMSFFEDVENSSPKFVWNNQTEYPKQF
jgi:hypothetical protein